MTELSAGPDAMPSGLSETEAQLRLQAEGPNELPRTEHRTLLRIVLEVLREPMMLLLLGGGAIYLVLGSLEEALVLLAFATLSVMITIIQEARTERVLETLRDLTSPRALVIRDGQRRRIAGRDVVRGDLVVLSEGDRVPADAVLLQCRDLQADESLLTGESVPVRKVAVTGDLPHGLRPGGDGLPQVYSGSLIVGGSGIGQVIATGAASEIGRIGVSLAQMEAEPPRLVAETRRIIRLFAIIGGVVSLLAVALYVTLRGGLLDGVLVGIALGMSMLPEEFPVVLTIFMAMGAWRISQARVLTRRAAAIETLGAATVLCTDKTGTLTENRMTLTELRLPSGSSFACVPGGSPLLADQQAPADHQALAGLAALASAPNPFDPMEKALHAAAPPPPEGARLLHGYGISPTLLAMSNVWQRPAQSGLLVAAKGAPEAIAALCRLEPEAHAAMTREVEAMASAGLRVLGVARADWAAGQPLPDGQQGFAFRFAGLVGLEDPLRASVPAAVRECRSAGIRVVMITGDFPATARAIAGKAGISAEMAVSGDELRRMDAAELAACVRSCNVFARIMPEQKLRIVAALKAAGDVVAMTGDGVNDAPSLKAAHIGIAMGGRGTDVAREASAMVLLDDDFGSIVQAVRLGRRIYDNLRKAIGFIVAVHLPIAGLALLPLLLGTPILFGPMHIAFLEMVIDPVCSLVFEAEREEKDLMQRPPRKPESPLISRALALWGIVQGAFALLLCSGIYLLALDRGLPENEVRALTFCALVVAIIGLIFVNRSFSASPLEAVLRPSRALLVVLPVVGIMLAITLLWPNAAALFRFGPLHTHDLAVVAAAGIATVVGLEVIKLIWWRPARRRAGHN